MARVLGRMARGQGTMQDSDLMRDVGQNMLFKAFCALADGAVSPIDSSIKYFRDEYEEHVRLGRCPLREASPRLEGASARSGGTRGVLAQVLPEGTEVELGEVLGWPPTGAPPTTW